MTLKLSFFYNQGKAGFSEVYYVDGSNAKEHIDSMLPNLFRNMTIWRDPTTQLISVRASTVTTPKLSFSRTFPDQYFGGYANNLDDPTPDVVSTDAVVRFNGATGARRRIYLRGLRDDSVARTQLTGADEPSALFVKTLKAYAATITTLNYQIRYTVLPPAGGAVFTRITDIISDPVTPSFSVLGTGIAPPGDWVVGTQLVVQGMPSATVPHFPRVVTVVSRNTVGENIGVVVAFRKLAGGRVWLSKARATGLIYAYDPITDYQFERFSEHKTGRPFGQLRGRSRGVRVGL